MTASPQALRLLRAALPAPLRAAGEAPPEVAEQKPARAGVEGRAGVEEAVTVSAEARLSVAAPTW